MINKNKPGIIFLCGFMGTGKTTVGQTLARILNVSFRDLDDVIEERAGRSISTIFEEEGEAAFRNKERSVLEVMVETYSGVLALGGGSLQNQELTDYVKENGLLIFIETPISVILERISMNQNRPLLLDENGDIKEPDTLKKELQCMYKRRLSLYKQADISVSGSAFPSVDELVKKLIQLINKYVSTT